MEWLPRRRWSLLPKVLHSFLSSSRLLELFHQIIPTHSILKLSTRQANKHKELVGTKILSEELKSFSCIQL